MYIKIYKCTYTFHEKSVKLSTQVYISVLKTVHYVTQIGHRDVPHSHIPITQYSISRNDDKQLILLFHFQGN